jgi:imidazolonepropionase-like amidohydrolase
MTRVRPRLLLVLVASIMVPVAAAGTARPVAAETLALVGATVHPVSGPPIAGATVLVDSGRITAVGVGLEPPAGARRVDLDGLELYPGLLNASTELGLTEIGAVEATVDTRELGEINPNARPESSVNPSSELIPVTRAAGVLMALTAGSGDLIPGTAAVLYTDGWTWEEMTLRAPVALVVHWPRMHIARAGREAKAIAEDIEARDAKLHALRETFANARAYWQARTAAGDGGAGDATARDRGVPPVEGDVKWEAMGEVVRGEVPVLVRAERLLQIRAALDWAAAEGVRLVIDGGAEAWRLADTLAARDVPVIVRRVSSLPVHRDDPYDARYACAALLDAAGVRIAFATGGASNARNLPFEAGMAVAYGLPPEAAVEALTLGAARILGVDDRVGSIEVGKEATLIATQGEVLDIRSTVERAWIAGREVDLESRHTRLHERYRARPPLPEG